MSEYAWAAEAKSARHELNNMNIVTKSEEAKQGSLLQFRPLLSQQLHGALGYLDIKNTYSSQVLWSDYHRPFQIFAGIWQRTVNEVNV